MANVVALTLERRPKLIIGGRCIVVVEMEDEYSYLNRLANNSSGRQKRKSTNNTAAINVPSARNASGYWPEETEVVRRLPRPCSVYVFEPSDIISAAVRKYHPPDHDIMLL